MNATVGKLGFAGQGGFVCPLWKAMLFSPAKSLLHSTREVPEPCESLSGSSRSGVLCWDRRAGAGVATGHEGSALPNTVQSSGKRGAEQIQ